MRSQHSGQSTHDMAYLLPPTPDGCHNMVHYYILGLDSLPQCLHTLWVRHVCNDVQPVSTSFTENLPGERKARLEQLLMYLRSSLPIAIESILKSRHVLRGLVQVLTEENVFQPILAFLSQSCQKRKLQKLKLVFERLASLFPFRNKAIFCCHKRQVLGDATAHCFMPQREEVCQLLFSAPGPAMRNRECRTNS